MKSCAGYLRSRRRAWKAVLICCMAAAFAALAVFCAAAEDGQEVTASTYNMRPGETLDISRFSGATYVRIAAGSGTYVLRGSSSRCTVEVKAKANEQIRVIFGDPSGADRDTGFRLVATKDCPGLATIQRAALVAEGEKDATIILSSAPGTHCYFRSKADAIPLLGCDPAIRKFRYDYTLIFDTENPDDPGTIEAVADPKGHRTAAIGGDDLSSSRNGLGNVVFENGIIIARGSKQGDGGPGIGAPLYVDGLTFNHATVYAYAGGHAAAAIGTATGELIPIYADSFTTVRNITINGGEIHALHESSSSRMGGAGLGGGMQGNCENLTINGGTVYAVGNSGSAGIGGGAYGDCVNLVINGGTVHAQGDVAGIGSGYMSVMTEGCHGQFSITIREADPQQPTVVTAVGGLQPDGSPGMDAVGIGGWLPLIEYREHHGIKYDDIREGKRSVTIEGGTISAAGNGVGSGIGAGADGFAETITISGGRIEARSGENGCAIGGAVTKSGWYYGAGARWILISGGTIRLSKPDGSPGVFGACIVKDHHSIEKTTGHLVISGGNVAGGLFNLTPQSKQHGGSTVFRNDIAIQTYGLSRYRNSYVAVEALGIREDWAYGLNDVYTFPEENPENPVLCVWLPEDRRVVSVRTKTPYLGYGYISRAEPQYAFYGLTEAKKGGTLYPPVCFLVDGNFVARNLDFMPYVDVRIGETSGEIRNPLTHDTFYTLDAERTIPLVRADGSYYPGVQQGEIQWTDAEGRMLIRGPGSGLDKPSGYKNGFQIFTRYTSLEIGFGEGKPAGATTELAGTLPERIPFKSDQTSVNLPASAQLVLPGYDLCGWNTDPAGSGKHFDLGAPVTKEEVHFGQGLTFTLYPEWQPREYTITFRAGPEAGAPEHRQAARFDQPGTLDLLSSFTEAGWSSFGRLHGWADTALGSFQEDGEDYFNLCDLNDQGIPLGRTLTAVWLSGGEISVSVTLDGAGVTGLESSFRAAGGAAEFRLPMISPSAGVYVFTPSGPEGGAGALPPGAYHLLLDDETYAVPEGLGTFTYAAGASVSITLDYDTVSVARGPGEAENITGLSLRENGTGRPGSSLVVPDGGRVLLEVNTAPGRHPAAFTVAGVPPVWEDPDNPAKPSQMILVRGRAGITVRTEPNLYAVVFDPNGGTGLMEKQDMVYGESRRLSPLNYTREHYRWTGWNTSADGAGTAYGDMESVRNLTPEHLAQVVLYAIWEPVVYTVSYDLGGGRIPGGRSNPSAYTAEDAFTLINPVRGNSVFSGWTGTGLSERTSRVSIPRGSGGDRSYAAHWKVLKSLAVIFQDTGSGAAAGIPDPIIFYPGSGNGITLPPGIPEKTGFYFSGWNTEADGSGSLHMPGARVWPEEDLLLYAMWSTQGCRITFDPAGGTLNGQEGPFTLTCARGLAITIPEAPVREGWKFLYWQGSAYHPGEKYIVTGDHTFTARWEAIPPPVPKTGDRGNPFLWLVLMLLGLVMGSVVLLPGNRGRKK